MTTTMRPEASHLTRNVFGITRDLPLNYVARDSADNRLIESLTRDKHIVIYGSSKQGKTSLRKNCLTEKDAVVVQCQNRGQLSDLHSSILKAAGYELSESTTRTVGGKAKVIAKGGFKVPLLMSAEGGGEGEASYEQETVTRKLELDAQDVNDVIEALQAAHFNQYIILEDFHYLPIDVQKDFAVSLKAFHERSSYCFIVIGVWLEENRLTVYNGDLTGRIISINADQWTENELRQVIASGEALLNISFSDEFKDAIVGKCYDSVYILQEVCYQCCTMMGITHTTSSCPTVGEGVDVSALITQVVNEQTGRYTSFIAQFTDGFQTTELTMYRWLLLPVIEGTVAELETGLKFSHIRRAIQAKHPRGDELNPGNVTQALQSTASLQVKKDIKPIILDYDQTNLRLNVVDKSFLIWLDLQDRNELLDLAGLPFIATPSSSSWASPS